MNKPILNLYHQQEIVWFKSEWKENSVVIYVQFLTQPQRVQMRRGKLESWHK